MKIISKIIVILFVFSLFVPLVNAEISLGVETKIWRFMWVDGKLPKISELNSHQLVQWKVADKNLDVYMDLDGRWNTVDVYQEIDGPDDFKRLKEIINQHKARNIEVVFRLYENVKIYDELLPTPSGDYSYNKEYYEWVKKLAKVFRDDVKYYLISNESEQDLGHRYYDERRKQKIYITYYQYKKLLNTAYKAIKDVDKSLFVVDHGISGYSLGLAVANAIYNENGINEALAFWREFRHVNNTVTTNIQMLRLLKRKDVTRRVEFAEKTFSDPGRADFYQLHHYGDWRSLSKILDWVSESMVRGGAIRPLFAAEVGYSLPSIEAKDESGRTRRIADWTHYSEDQHAEFLVKDFMILICAGVERIQYWDLRWDNEKVPIGKLFHASNDPDQFIPFKAGIAYKNLAKVANGRTASHMADVKFKGLHGCALRSDDTIYAVWADGVLPKEITNTENIFWKAVDMYGRQIPIPSADGKKLLVGKDLVYLYVK